MREGENMKKNEMKYNKIKCVVFCCCWLINVVPFFCIMKWHLREIEKAGHVVRKKKRAILSPLEFLRSNFERILLQNSFNPTITRKSFKS